MNKLRLLKLNDVYLRDNCYEHLSKRLRWLYWSRFPLESIPSNLFMEEMVVLEMPFSSLKQVWKANKIVDKLKVLNLSHSYHLTKTPDFSGLINLELLLLNNCIRLVKVHHSIEYLEKLIVLDLENCRNLRKLPLGIWKLTSLQKLSLNGCSKLGRLLPGSEGSLSKPWFSPFMSCISVVRNPIKLPPTNRFGLISIKMLDLTYCNLLNVPDELGSLLSLETLTLEGNNFCTLPNSISHLHKLRFLCLNQCTRLQILPKLPESIIAVIARHCPLLERIPIENQSLSFGRISNGSHMAEAHELTISRYHNLFPNNRENRIGYFKNQGLSDELSIALPNFELPAGWADGISFGSDLSLVVPESKVQGWDLAVFYTIHRYGKVSEYDLHYLPPFFYTVKNKTKGFQKRYEPTVQECPMIFNDHILVYFVRQPPAIELQIEAGDKLEYSISVVNPLFLVKRFGVFLLSDDSCNLASEVVERGCYDRQQLNGDQMSFQQHPTVFQQVQNSSNEVTNSNKVPIELLQ